MGNTVELRNEGVSEREFIQSLDDMAEKRIAI